MRSILSFGLVFMTAFTCGPALSFSDRAPDAAADVVIAAREAFRKEKLGDSHLRVCESKPWLALREGDLQELRRWRENGIDDPKTLAGLARACSARAGRFTVQTLPRLSSVGQNRISAQIAVLRHQGDLKKVLLGAYLSLGEREAQSLRSMTAEGRGEWIEDVLHGLESSIKTKGRHFREFFLFPGAPFVYGWMGQHILREYYGPKTPEFKNFLVYHPREFNPRASTVRETGTSRSADLLHRFAPVIVQEIPESPDYPPDDNLIGKLEWRKNDQGRLQLEPNVRHPAVYAFRQDRRIGVDQVTQLIYTHWYAEHPPLKFADAEAGHLEGLTVRITLDSEEHPLVYETIYDCGCYHRMYVSRRLENLAREKFGPPLSGKTYSIEQKTHFKIDLIVLDALPDPKENEHPLLFCWAAYHLPGKIAIGEISEFTQGDSLGDKGYDLLPYRALETAEWKGTEVGVFDYDGLIYGGARREGCLLSPTGIYDAGHPRQRGTQIIHFDQEDFEDPDLFINRLRWPGAPKD